ncbi:MAG: hypothetical protein JXQ76_04110, partial [Campylobacterales bacterium]|nr:hypothetical protein [Campylobacterales bacterium]
MRSLLIRNNNVASLKSFDTTIDFRASSDIDSYITHKIIPQLLTQNFDILYIKDNLSSNYLELYGLRLLYHIRLSAKLKDKRFVPIVILSDIDGWMLNHIDSMARVLLTQNVSIIPNQKTSIDAFKNQELRNLTKEEYQNNFLNLIEVQSPENSSSHSIANEWAIDRWAKFLKVKSDAIQRNSDKIDSMIYFKYLLAKNPIERDRGLGVKVPKLGGKILYIDDEWDKGWSDIFAHYFSKNSNITFNPFRYDFKDKKESNIIEDIKEALSIDIPDIVILDLRLLSSDHKKSIKIDEYTGIKMTQIIKAINPAIEVIMFTATSKSRILDELYQHKILGYIKKESPQEKNISTKENFNKLADLVDRGLAKKYLKEIWSIQEEILKLKLFDGIELEIKSVFEILDSGMENRYIYAMFAIFKVIEIINHHY